MSSNVSWFQLVSQAFAKWNHIRMQWIGTSRSRWCSTCPSPWNVDSLNVFLTVRTLVANDKVTCYCGISVCWISAKLLHPPCSSLKGVCGLSINLHGNIWNTFTHTSHGSACTVPTPIYVSWVVAAAATSYKICWGRQRSQQCSEATQMLKVSVVNIFSHWPQLPGIGTPGIFPSFLSSGHDGVEGCKSQHCFGHSNWKIQSTGREGCVPSCLRQRLESNKVSRGIAGAFTWHLAVKKHPLPWWCHQLQWVAKSRHPIECSHSNSRFLTTARTSTHAIHLGLHHTGCAKPGHWAESSLHCFRG